MHRYLKPVALLAAAAGVLFLAAAGQASGRSTSSLYIVQFAGKPLATYAGGLKGFHATRPIKGARIDTHTTNAIGYRPSAGCRVFQTFSRSRRSRVTMNGVGS